MKRLINSSVIPIIIIALLFFYQIVSFVHKQSMDCEKFREVKASDIPAKCLAYWQPVQPQQPLPR